MTPTKKAAPVKAADSETENDQSNDTQHAIPLKGNSPRVIAVDFTNIGNGVPIAPRGLIEAEEAWLAILDYVLHIDGLNQPLEPRASFLIDQTQFCTYDGDTHTIVVSPPDRILSNKRLSSNLHYRLQTAIRELRYDLKVAFNEADGTDLASTDDTKWKVYTGADILNRADDDPDWLAAGVLARKEGLLQSGLPKSGKSLAWLCGGIELAAGKMLWNKFRVPIDPPHVLFVETEDSLNLVTRRARWLAKGLGLKNLPNNFHLVTPGPFNLVSVGLARLSELIKLYDADLLILSTLQGLIVGRDWNTQIDMGEVNEVSVTLQRLAALVMITHSPQSGAPRAIGTVTQAANYSTLMHFDKRASADATTISVKLDSKESEPHDFRLAIDLDRNEENGTTHVLRVHGIERSKGGRPTKGRASLKEQARVYQAGGMSYQEIADTMGIPKSNAYRLIKDESD